MSPVIEARNLTKTYDHEVLNVSSLAVQEGSILCVMGPSGSGKTTLLRLISGLEPPSTGTLRVLGHGLPGDGPLPLHLRRRMTLLPQRPLLLRASVADNIAYGLKARRLPPDLIRTRVSELLDRLGLSAMAGRAASKLSGGEAQRVALARAVAFEPDLLLLDEPTASLDPANVETIENLIAGLNRDGMTVVVVTHSVFQARRLAHRTAFLWDGTLVEEGPAESVFADPGDPRTRAFIEGRMIY